MQARAVTPAAAPAIPASVPSPAARAAPQVSGACDRAVPSEFEFFRDMSIAGCKVAYTITDTVNEFYNETLTYR